MELKELGKTTLVSALQPLKHSPSIPVKEVGNVRLVRSSHSKKAWEDTVLTPAGMAYAPLFPSGQRMIVSLALFKSTPLTALNVAFEGSTVMEERLLAYKKALTGKVSTLAGKWRVDNPSQSLKANPSMVLTLAGIMMLVSLIQPEKAYCPTTVTPEGMTYSPLFLPGH
jgi:hypothetical protein